MSDSPAETRPAGETLRPTGDAERIVTLDVLRGLAILGILFVNIGMFSFPEGYSDIHRELFGGTADRIVHWATLFFIEGKFYSLFSVLFGIGAAIQFDRARRRGRRFGPWYARRLLVLLAIGLVHDICLFSGIILLTYSIVGFGLLPFFRRRSKTILVWTVVMILIPVVVVTAYLTARPAADGNGSSDRATTGAPTDPDDAEDERAAFEQEVARFAGGSYLELVRIRVAKVPESLGVSVALGTFVLGLFLIGLLLWRSGWLTDPVAHARQLRRLLAWGLLVGGSCTAGYVTVRALFTQTPPVPVLVPALAAQLVGNMALCLGYLAAVVLAMMTDRGRRLLLPFSPVGRTALSNYIFQSAVGTTIFYGHGLGLYGTVGPAVNLLLVLVIFAVQLVLSAWWLRRFRFGPVEWVWRCLTYGRRFPIRRQSTPSAAATAAP